MNRLSDSSVHTKSDVRRFLPSAKFGIGLTFRNIIAFARIFFQIKKLNMISTWIPDELVFAIGNHASCLYTFHRLAKQIVAWW